MKEVTAEIRHTLAKYICKNCPQVSEIGSHHCNTNDPECMTLAYATRELEALIDRNVER